MAHSIQKYEQLPPELKTKMEQTGEEIAVGDLFFSKDYDIRLCRIREIIKYKKKDEDYTVCYDVCEDWEGLDWRSYGSDSFDNFLKKISSGKYVIIRRPLAEVLQESQDVLDGKISTDIYYQSEHDNVSEENALISRNSKEGLITIQKSLEEKRRQADLIHKGVTFLMEKRKAELEAVRQKMYGAIAKFQKQIERVMRVITTIELYLGIDEELFQLQSGQTAPIDTPISFRQKVLFIDEEVGAHENGGLDFRSLETFDNWLITGNNIDIVLPEKKGIVVLRPRRNDKDYKDNWLNIVWNIENRNNTYILIRNGDNLYRIYTEKLVIHDRLFPLRKEMQQLVEAMQKKVKEAEGWSNEDERKQEAKEEVEDAMYHYKKRAVLLQGLVDRTEVFLPLPVERLNIFKLEENSHLVNFIYDDEAALPTGRLGFWGWHKQINEKISQGSRILLTNYESDYDKYDKRDSRKYQRGYTPYPPTNRVYEVEEYKQEDVEWLEENEYQAALKSNKIVKLVEENDKHWRRQIDEEKDRGMNYDDSNMRNIKGYKVRIINTHLTILYNPEDTIYGSWGDYDPHERKKRIRYRIFREDKFVINYDQISLEEVDFYLKSRVDRPQYLRMMPILKNLRAKLIEEEGRESFFVRFVSDRNFRALAPLTDNQIQGRVWESIRWWKFKNKWKRPINKDDALALRMIERRILSSNYNKFKKF